MLAALDIEVVWDGTKSHNGGLLMAAAEERPMKKETVTKGPDGWGFETLDGRRGGFPSRDAARLARKEWMDAPPEKQEEEMPAAPAPVVAKGATVAESIAAVLPPNGRLEGIVNGTPTITKPSLTPTGRKRVTADEVTAVLNLRAAGMSFQRIEAELGWDDHHGCKARRIVQDAAAAHALAAKNDAKA